MILRTRGLSKVFEVGFRRRRVQAVQDLDLSVEQGEIFGFVGPNGAGKTTTIKMLMGLIYPTRGQAFVFDTPIPSQEARRRIGYLPGESLLLRVPHRDGGDALPGPALRGSLRRGGSPL